MTSSDWSEEVVHYPEPFRPMRTTGECDLEFTKIAFQCVPELRTLCQMHGLQGGCSAAETPNAIAVAILSPLIALLVVAIVVVYFVMRPKPEETDETEKVDGSAETVRTIDTELTTRGVQTATSWEQPHWRPTCREAYFPPGPYLPYPPPWGRDWDYDTWDRDGKHKTDRKIKQCCTCGPLFKCKFKGGCFLCVCCMMIILILIPVAATIIGYYRGTFAVFSGLADKIGSQISAN